jgi:hypothetical protein
MRYIDLETAGILQIAYTGTPLDLYSHGVLSLSLHDVIERTAITLIERERDSFFRPRYLFTRRRSSPAIEELLRFGSLVRAEIRQVRIGSLEQEVSFALASVLANPNTIAILQNLAANVIWAIGASGLRGIRQRIPQRFESPIAFPRREDPLEIGVNLQAVMVALAEHNDGRPCELTFKYRSQNEETMEVTLRINNSNDQ